MSDESIHSQKGATLSPSRDAVMADLIFSTAPPVPALPKEVLGDARYVVLCTCMTTFLI